MLQAIKSKGLVYYLSYILILVIFFFSYYPTRSWALLGSGVTPYFLGIVFSIICIPAFFKTRNAWLIIMYIFVVFLNHFWGNKAVPTVGAALTESIAVFLPAAVLYLVMYRRDFSFNAILLYTFLFVVTLTTVQSFFLDQMFPGLIRAVVNMEDKTDVQAFFNMGLSSYQLPHALPILIPPCIMIIKKPEKKLQRIIGIVFLAVIIILVGLSQSFGAFILALFALFASIFVREQSVDKNIRVLLFLSLLFIILMGETVQVAIIDFLRGFFESGSKIDEKLTDLAVGVVNDNISDVSGNRGNLFQATIDAIIRNPIFGVDDKSYGHHNALFDRWACFGLVGFIPLVLFIYYNVKETLKAIPLNLQTYYMIGVISSLIMMTTKNMMGWFQWLCFVLILPLMFLVWKEKECNKL